MQQFTLPLKASLASEDKALGKKFGQVLCYLLQLSPSALCSAPALRCPSWPGNGDLASPGTAVRGEDNYCLHPPQHSCRTYSHTLHRSQLLCGTEYISTASVRAARALICNQKTPIKFRFPVLETHRSSCWWAMLCHHGGVPWPTPCSLQTLSRSTRRNCPIISQKSHWRQQEAAAGGMETSLSSPFAEKVIWSLQLWTTTSLYLFHCISQQIFNL